MLSRVKTCGFRWPRGVEHGMENCLSLRLGDVAAARRPPQLHRAVSEHGDLKPGPPELASRKIRHIRPLSRQRANAAHAAAGTGGPSAGFRLLTVQIERLHHRRVREAEQKRGTVAVVHMLPER